MSFKTHVSQKVMRFLLKRTGGDWETAEEVLQETFLAVQKSYSSFHKKSTFFTWICKIALNKLADHYRSRIRHRSKVVVPAVEMFNQIFDPALSNEERLSLDELKHQVNGCLRMLPEEYRQLLELRYYEQLSQKEISLKLNLPVRSLEGKLYRAKKLLAKIYAKDSSGD